MEDMGKACKAFHPLLDSCSTRVVQRNHWSTVLEGQVLYFGDFLGISCGKRTTHHRKVECIDKNQPAINLPVTRYHSVSIHLLLFHSKIGASMGDITV